MGANTEPIDDEDVPGRDKLLFGEEINWQKVQNNQFGFHINDEKYGPISLGKVEEALKQGLIPMENNFYLPDPDNLAIVANTILKRYGNKIDDIEFIGQVTGPCSEEKAGRNLVWFDGMVIRGDCPPDVLYDIVDNFPRPDETFIEDDYIRFWWD